MSDNTNTPAPKRRHRRSPESVTPTLHPNHLLSRDYRTPRPTTFVHRESQVRKNLWAAWSVIYDTHTLVIDMRYTTPPAPGGEQHVEGDLELVVSEISNLMGIVVGELNIVVRTDHNFPVSQPVGNDVDRPLSLVARPFEHEGVLEDPSVFVVDLVVATVHGHLSHESSSPQGRSTVEWPRRSSQSTPDGGLLPGTVPAGPHYVSGPTRARTAGAEPYPSEKADA